MTEYFTKFRDDDDTPKLIEFIKKVNISMRQEDIPMSDHIYKTLVNMLVSFQNWELLIDVLERSDSEIMTSDERTLQYLKESLIYCLDTKQRDQIRNLLNRIDERY